MNATLQHQRSGAFSLGKASRSHVLQLTLADKPTLVNLLQAQRAALLHNTTMPPQKKADIDHFYQSTVKLLKAPPGFQLPLKQFIALDEHTPWVNAHVTLREDAYGGTPWLNDVFSHPHTANNHFSFKEFSTALLAYFQRHEGVRNLKYTTTRPQVRERYHQLWGTPAEAGTVNTLNGKAFATDVISLTKLPQPSVTLMPGRRDVPIDQFMPRC